MDTFICPYVGVELPLNKSCSVDSCSFNLADVPVAKVYRRCFLNYVKATGHNPHKLENLEQVEYGSLPVPYREQIARILLNLTPEDEANAKRTFYISLFSILAHDTTIAITKRQHDPIPYQQCCICGRSDTQLWYPKGGILPSGYGYCSWNCWQEYPPPMLALMKIIEVDFKELFKNLSFQGYESRLIFTKHLIQWVFGISAIK